MAPVATPTTSFASAVDAAVAASVDALQQSQRPDGGWSGNLSPNAAATGDVLIAMHLADPSGSADLIERGARWLRETQQADGGWGDDVDTPPTLNCTAIAIAALHLVTPTESAAHVRRGVQFIERAGGIAALEDVRQCSLSVLVRFYLALAGLTDERKLFRIPVELILLPAPIRHKLTFAMPTAMAWGVMNAHQHRAGPLRKLLNERAEPRALAYLDQLVAFGNQQGGFEESPMMAANVCIGLTVAGLRPDIVRRCLRYFRDSVKPEGAWSVNRDLELSVSTFVTMGLQDSGIAARDRLASAARWVRRCQRHEDFPATGAPGGGWGWAMPSGWPNTGDTADALLTVTGDGMSNDHPIVQAGRRWLTEMQNDDGSWSCFCRVGLLSALDPSFGVTPARSPKVLYGACSVMTADAISALFRSSANPVGDPRLSRALRWLGRAQHDDGALDCKWYQGRVAGTGCALRAFGDVGLGHHPTARRLAAWLRLHQNLDGGWGDATIGTSTAEETAWAMLGLLAAGVPAEDRMLRDAADWLVANQVGGRWQPNLVGVYFLELLYKSDLTADGYALQALARYRAALRR